MRININSPPFKNKVSPQRASKWSSLALEILASSCCFYEILDAFPPTHLGVQDASHTEDAFEALL